MLVGEAPGREEDKEGRPFVGRAGKLLRNILKELNLANDIYITNSVKCRPPNNRAPTEIERRTCKRYLIAEINCIDPLIIVALGRVASKSLLERDVKLTIDHGKIFENVIGNKRRKVIVTYHPAAILRRRELKDKLINDLKKAKKIYFEELRKN